MARQLFLADLLVVRDLVAVHAAVRLGDGLVELGRVGEPVGPDGQRDVVRDTRAQLREARLELMPRDLRHQDEELVATDAVGMLVAAAVREQVGRALQGLIASPMAVLVIDLLEAVDIGVDDAHSAAPLHQRVDRQVERIAVPQARQRIVAAQMVELFQEAVVRELGRDEVRYRLKDSDRVDAAVPLVIVGTEIADEPATVVDGRRDEALDALPPEVFRSRRGRHP